MEPISEQRHPGSAVQLSGSVSEKRNRKRNGKPLEPVIVVSMISTMKRPKADFFILFIFFFFYGTCSRWAVAISARVLSNARRGALSYVSLWSVQVEVLGRDSICVDVPTGDGVRCKSGIQLNTNSQWSCHYCKWFKIKLKLKSWK